MAGIYRFRLLRGSDKVSENSEPSSPTSIYCWYCTLFPKPVRRRASTGTVGLTALRGHVETYGRAIAEWETRASNAASARDYFEVLEAIAPLSRATSNLSATLQVARENFPDVHELITLRDEAADLERSAELLQIDAKNALEFHIARQNEAQARFALDAARAGHRLNIIAAITLPLTAVTGVFGMTLPSGLENASPALFWGIFAGGAIFGGLLGVLVSRKS
ncbi:MAG TPA: CorA family divalent cation transporter [Abditibacterium sp.]